MRTDLIAYRSGDTALLILPAIHAITSNRERLQYAPRTFISVPCDVRDARLHGSRILSLDA